MHSSTIETLRAEIFATGPSAADIVVTINDSVFQQRHQLDVGANNITFPGQLFPEAHGILKLTVLEAEREGPPRIHRVTWHLKTVDSPHQTLWASLSGDEARPEWQTVFELGPPSAAAGGSTPTPTGVSKPRKSGSTKPRGATGNRGIGGGSGSGTGKTAPVRGGTIRRAPAPTPTEVKYPVFFGTNRAFHTIEGEQETHRLGLSDIRSETISYGTCVVRVPISHRPKGSLGRWWTSLIPGRDDTVRLEVTTFLTDAEFWAAIANRIKAGQPTSNIGIVFIHGYNVSFENAARRAAQLGCDLMLEGPMAFFSWPSPSNLVTYTVDEALIEESEHAIGEFLVDFANKSGIEGVHVLAHSMGNRALVRVMERIVLTAHRQTGLRFGHLVMAAPDVTAPLFAKVESSYREMARRTTLYVADNDRALKASGILHGATRLGSSEGGVPVIEHVDTIVASDLKKDWLGHDYFASTAAMINDLRLLLFYDKPPAERMMDASDEERPPSYWVLRA